MAPETLVLVLVFVAVAGISAAVVGLFTGNPMSPRLQQAAGGEALEPVDGKWQAKLAVALSPAGKLAIPKEGWENSKLRQQFMHAGFRGEEAPLIFFGIKTVLTLALPLAFMLATGLWGTPLSFNMNLFWIVWLAGAGYYLPNIYLRRRVQHRQRDMFETLPDAIDLMTVSVEAGLGLDAAIARVADEIGARSRAVEEEFRLVGLELRAGASREQALRNLALRTGVDELDILVAMLVQTDRFGTSVAEALRVHSDALRTKRRLRAEEEAARIALKLLFPLIFCIFPSIMVVLVGPAAISIYRAFVRLAAGS
jgi:tight adherence protein C